MCKHVLLTALIATSTSVVLSGCGGNKTEQTKPPVKASQAQVDAEIAKINKNANIPPDRKPAAIEEMKRRLGVVK